MNDYKFGNFIYKLRVEKGLTQADVAQKIGVTPAAVSKWENGSAKPRYEVLLKLAEILDVSTEELVRGEHVDEQPPEQDAKQNNVPVWIIVVLTIVFILLVVSGVALFRNPATIPQDTTSVSTPISETNSAESTLSSATSSKKPASSDTNSLKPISSKTSSATSSTAPKPEEVNTVGNVNGNGQRSAVVVKQGDWVYYCHVAHLKNLMRMKNDGSQRQTLFKGYIESINVLGDWIYYHDSAITEGIKGIYKAKPDGSEKTLILEGQYGYLFVADGWVYYTDGNQVTGGRLHRVRTDGTDNQKLTDDICMSINIVGDMVYYVIDDKNYVYQMKTDGTERQRFSPAITAKTVVVEGNALYTYDGSSFQHINLDGTGYKRYPLEDVEFFTVYGGYVYYTKSKNEITTYYKSNLDMSETIELITVNGPYSNMMYTCVVNDWLYFPNGEDRLKMYRVKTDGSEKLEPVR